MRQFAPRVQALWAQRAAGRAASGAAVPDIVEPDPARSPVPGGSVAGAAVLRVPERGYLLHAEYLHELVALVPLPPADKRRLAFGRGNTSTRSSPTNFPATNPDVLRKAIATEGGSLVHGCRNLAEDARKGRITMTDEAAFEVGRNLALDARQRRVPQRAHRTDPVRADDAARAPAAAADRAAVHQQVLHPRPAAGRTRSCATRSAQGHTVFMISWRNIPPELGHLTWDDYLENGVLAALEVAAAITGSTDVNALGFCVGGTLLACALAVLAARRDAQRRERDVPHDDARLRRSRARSASTCRASCSPRASRR